MKSKKEIAFEKEYKILIEKYNVELVVRSCIYEEGTNIEVSFKELGKYCNINYSPKIREEETKHFYMGQ